MARRAQRRKIGTAQKAKDFAKIIGDDLKDEITVQLNSFVRAVISDLTTDAKKGGVSPVLTGFFASSWKAGLTRPNRNEERESFTPWSNIKTTVINGKTVLASGSRPYIKQRHSVPTTFTLNKSIFIGNTARYAPQAVLSPKSQVFSYLAGGAGGFKEGLNQKIDKFFTDKRPDIRVGGDVDAADRISYLKL
tara:strand:- start:1332 stop:1907 length:576 start_codon:yes stop_codon:yes gene_type:complete